MIPNFFTLFLLFLSKEVTLIRRSHESLIAVVFFSFVVILIFHFGFALEGPLASSFVLSFVWLATLFGGMLRMNQTFEHENEGKVLDGLRLAGSVATPFWLSKFVFNIFYLLFLEVVSFFLVVVLFNVDHPLGFLSRTWLPLFLGTLGFACIGTTFSSMVASHNRHHLILPVIVYPMIAPLIIGVLKSVVFGTNGSVLGLDGDWIKILVAFDLIFMVMSLVVFEKLWES